MAYAGPSVAAPEPQGMGMGMEMGMDMGMNTPTLGRFQMDISGAFLMPSCDFDAMNFVPTPENMNYILHNYIQNKDATVVSVEPLGDAECSPDQPSECN